MINITLNCQKRPNTLLILLKAIYNFRHVVHDNKVTKNYGVNQHQSKRYIDEDACNPFTALGGSSARPAFPLTPAAVINGSGSR